MRWLALGIESGSEHVRDGAEKSFRPSRNRRHRAADSGCRHQRHRQFHLRSAGRRPRDHAADAGSRHELNCEFANFYSAMAYPGSPLYPNGGGERLGAARKPGAGIRSTATIACRCRLKRSRPREVLKFRDDAFDQYFTDKRYLEMVTQKFGWDTRRTSRMIRHKLRRKIVEDTPEPARTVQPPDACAELPDERDCLGGWTSMCWPEDLARGFGRCGHVPKLLAPIGGRPFLTICSSGCAHSERAAWCSGSAIRPMRSSSTWRNITEGHLRGDRRRTTTTGHGRRNPVCPAPAPDRSGAGDERRQLRRADLCDLVERHQKSNARASILCTEVPAAKAGRR